MAEPQFAEGEKCTSHSHLDCHECGAVMVNRNPSTAHYENGEYIPCPQNQPFAYQDRQPHSLGQLKHGVSPGYCAAHLRLGCERCIPDAT